jgi:putative membrane protein
MLVFVAAQVFRGFCMGAADVVPGVSGGTIALVLGIYERLVGTVRQGASVLGHVARFDGTTAARRFRQVDWIFIIPLLLGIGTAIVVLARPIEHLLEERPVEMAAGFFGLVVASIGIAWDGLRNRDSVRLAAMVAMGIATFWLLGLRTAEEHDPALWFVFLAGAIAVCAMILPGVSGSFLLLMLGLYDYVIAAVNDRDLLILGIFLAGCVIGLAGFSSLLHAMLRRYRDTVLAVLIGLMLGSLRVLWPWPGGVESTSLGRPEWGDVPLAVLVALGAAVVVLLLTRWSRRLGPR